MSFGCLKWESAMFALRLRGRWTARALGAALVLLSGFRASELLCPRGTFHDGNEFAATSSLANAHTRFSDEAVYMGARPVGSGGGMKRVPFPRAGLPFPRAEGRAPESSFRCWDSGLGRLAWREPWVPLLRGWVSAQAWG